MKEESKQSISDLENAIAITKIVSERAQQLRAKINGGTPKEKTAAPVKKEFTGKQAVEKPE